MNKIKLTGFFLGPFLFIFLYFFLPQWSSLEAQACSVLAVSAWMVSWWVTEAVYVSVTALIPLVLFPVLGIMTVSAASSSYANSVVFLFMGGFILALALEKHNLHQRIALYLIKFTGTSGNGIIAGFMLATAFISMWISNTATAIMMLPIALSITQLFNSELSNADVPDAHYRNFSVGLMLSIAYSSSIGGIATIIGTPPNVVLAGLFNETYHRDITFLEWIKVALPIAVIILLLCYMLITRVIFPNHLKNVEGSGELIARKLRELGGFSRAEILVLGIFFLTSFCWIFRPYVNEWLLVWFGEETYRAVLDDATIAMGGGLLMFSVPVNLKKQEFILAWEDTKRLPWGILILFGGGICLARSLEDAQLIQLIGSYLAGQGKIQLWLLITILAFISIFLTELMSNVALTTIFVPVVFGLAEAFGYDPLTLAMPVTFAASCAFTLPVSTPPNAVMFAGGYVRLYDMVKAGVVLNIISLIIIVVLSMMLIA